MFLRDSFAGRSNSKGTSHQNRRGLRIEPLEHRTLLAVDVLAADPLPSEQSDSFIESSEPIVTQSIDLAEVNAIDLGSVDFRDLTIEAPEAELWYEMTTVRDGTLTVTALTSTPELYHTADLDPLRLRRGGREPINLYRVETDGSLQLVDSGMGRVDYNGAVAGQRYATSIGITWGDPTKTWVNIANVIDKDPSLGLINVYDAQDEDRISFYANSPGGSLSGLENPDDIYLIYNKYLVYHFDSEQFTSYMIHDVDHTEIAGRSDQLEHLESSPLLDAHDGVVGRAVLSGDWGTVEAHGTDVKVSGGSANFDPDRPLDTATFIHHGPEEVLYDVVTNIDYSGREVQSGFMSSTPDAAVQSNHRASGFGTIDIELDGVVAASPASLADPLDLGSIDYVDHRIESPELGELWYELTPVRDGTLSVYGYSELVDFPHVYDDPHFPAETIENPSPSSSIPSPDFPPRRIPESVSLYQVEPDGSLQFLLSDVGQIDLDNAVAGQRYVVSMEITQSEAIGANLTLANVLVKDLASDLVDIYDAEGENTVVLSVAGLIHKWVGDSIEIVNEIQVDYGSVEYTIEHPRGRVDKFRIHDVDKIYLHGAEGAVEHLDSSPLLEVPGEGIGLATLSGEWGTVEAYGTAVWVDGQAEDTALFSNHGLQEALFDVSTTQAGYQTTSMSSTAEATVQSRHYAKHFGVTEADAHGMGSATMDGTRGDDTFTGSMGLSELVLSDGRVIRVKNFPHVQVDSSPGAAYYTQNDVASLFDSAGNDTFTGNGYFCEMVYSDGSVIRVEQFHAVHAYAREGSRDVASLSNMQTPGRGTTNLDRFIGTPNYGRFDYSDGSVVRAKHFDYVHAYAQYHGPSLASLTGSPGDDQLTVKSNYAKLIGPDYFLRAKYFDTIVVNADDGENDFAQVFDTPDDDTLISRPGYATFTGENRRLILKQFESSIFKSTAGGIDVASLYDSSGDDRLIASPTQSKLFSSNYTQHVLGFDAVHSYAQAGGNDTASLYGSLGNDQLIATSKYVRVFNNDYVIRAKYFEQVDTDLRDGFDNIRLSLGAENDLITANPTSLSFSENSATKRFDYIFDQIEYAKVHSFDSDNDERDIDDDLEYQLYWG